MYRGQSISKKEFNVIKEGLEKKKENKGANFSLVSLFVKCFLSFSKNEKKKKKFLNGDISNEELFRAEFIIEPIEEENYEFFITNVDMEEFSFFGEDESEVLILPFSCLEAIDIEDKGDMKIIHFRYLNKCYKIILNYISATTDKDEIYYFYKNIIKSEYAKEIKKCNYYISKRLDEATYKYIYYTIPEVAKNFPILCNKHYIEKGNPKCYVQTKEKFIINKDPNSPFIISFKKLTSIFHNQFINFIKTEFNKVNLNQLYEEITKKIKNSGWNMNMRSNPHFGSYVLLQSEHLLNL